MTTVVQIHHQDPRIHIYDNGTSIALLQGPAHDVTKAYDKNNLGHTNREREGKSERAREREMTTKR